MPLTNEIDAQLKQKLTSKRYGHSVRTAETAHMLALRFKLDADKAYIAGLLHDCAKDMDVSTLLEIAKEIGIELNEAQRKKPVRFLHASIGAYIARQYYNVDDKDILQAISYHHEGSTDMTSFDKIIALADMTEPHRAFDDTDELRRILETDIDEAYLCGYRNGMVNYIRDGLLLEDTRIKVYNHLLLQKSAAEI